MYNSKCNTLHLDSRRYFRHCLLKTYHRWAHYTYVWNSISFLPSKTCLEHTFPFSEKHQFRPAARALLVFSHGLSSKTGERNLKRSRERLETFRGYPRGKENSSSKIRTSDVRSVRPRAQPSLPPAKGSPSSLETTKNDRTRLLAHRRIPIISRVRSTRSDIIRSLLVSGRGAAYVWHIISGGRRGLNTKWRGSYNAPETKPTDITARIKAIGKTRGRREASPRLAFFVDTTHFEPSPAFFLFDICDRRISRGETLLRSPSSAIRFCRTRLVRAKSHGSANRLAFLDI